MVASVTCMVPMVATALHPSKTSCSAVWGLRRPASHLPGRKRVANGKDLQCPSSARRRSGGSQSTPKNARSTDRKMGDRIFSLWRGGRPALGFVPRKPFGASARTECQISNIPLLRFVPPVTGRAQGQFSGVGEPSREPDGCRYVRTLTNYNIRSICQRYLSGHSVNTHYA